MTTSTESTTPETGPRIEKIGRRWYALDWPRAENNLLREHGTWDPDRRGWWTGKAETARSWEERLKQATVAAGAVEQAHAEGLCTWTRLGVPNGRWFVTGPEAVLRGGTVRVVRKGKPPEEIRVQGVRQVSGQWIADKVEEPRAAGQGREARSAERSRERDIPMVGTKDGATAVRTARFEARPYLPSLLGEVISTKNGYVIAIGAEAHHTTAGEEEDFGKPGTPSGWWVTLHVRPATPEEAAPQVAAEQAQHAEDEAKRAAAEQEKREWIETLERTTAGLMRISLWSRPIGPVERIALRRDGSTTIELTRYQTALGDGTVAVVGQYITSGDMDSLYTWAPREVALALLDAEIVQAHRGELTREKALAWLASYAGCQGTDLYRRAAGLDPWTGEG